VSWAAAKASDNKTERIRACSRNALTHQLLVKSLQCYNRQDPDQRRSFAHLIRSSTVVGCKVKLYDDKIVVVGKLIGILPEHEQLDELHKTVKLTSDQPTVLNSSLEFESTSSPGDGKSFLGHEHYVKVVKEYITTAVPT